MIVGWDDAPIVKLKNNSHPKHVTFVYPYYRNRQFLEFQIQGWRKFDQRLLDYLSLIIVDDGSPDGEQAQQVLIDQNLPMYTRLFYIEQDVRWNWLAARNLAMRYAEGWCIATDMDHVITEQVAESLIWQDHSDFCIYRFLRKEHTGQIIKNHPNSWFMIREMFWKFGGYDEALSGYYGTDGEARKRWVKTAPVYTLKQYLIRYEYYQDSSTVAYKRKQPMDMNAQAMIKARSKDWKPKVLSFPYHEVGLY